MKYYLSLWKLSLKKCKTKTFFLNNSFIYWFDEKGLLRGELYPSEFTLCFFKITIFEQAKFEQNVDINNPVVRHPSPKNAVKIKMVSGSYFIVVLFKKIFILKNTQEKYNKKNQVLVT